MPKNTSKKVQKKEENKREVKELIDDIEEDVDFDLESGSDNDDSTSESEDENAEAMSSKLDRDWFRTLAALKTNDPRIHDKNAKFYESSSSEEEEDIEERKKKKKSKKEKPYLLKDYQHEVLMKKGGIINEEEETPSTSFHHNTKAESEIKNSLKSAFINSDDEESSGDDFLKKRVKTQDQEQDEDGEYINWLKGQKHSLDNDKHVKKDLKPLKKLWNQPDLDENEKFLADFFLNKRYISKEQETSLPTYEEIVNEERQNFSKIVGKYKHRFEEPGGRTIPSYPRKIEDSVRRKDTRRADKNRDVRDRKLKHKEEKRKEIEKVKSSKRKEILAKIKKIQEITGNDKVGFTDEDLEGDFDPEKHDQMMKERFNDDYYNDEHNEEAKPVFQDDEDEDMNLNEDLGENGNNDYDNENGDNDESNFNMDDDYDPNQDLRVGKKRKKSKFTEAVKKKKPVFDPAEKSFPEYFDEYYNLDFEDVIGDLPCRYKYRKTQPNDFGLTVEEILAAPDKELNKWASAQNVVCYLTEEEERIEKIKYKKRGKSVMKKVNLMPTLRESLDPEALAEAEAKVKHKIDEKQKRKEMKSQPTSKRAKLRKLHRKFNKDNQNSEKKMSNVQKVAKVSDSRVKAYGYDPRKLNYLHTDNFRKSS